MAGGLANARLGGVSNLIRVLRNPNYGAYALGNVISLTGTWAQRVAVGWLTWKLTQSGTWLGLISLAELSPTVLIGPFAGAAADRWDRMLVTKVSQWLSLVQAVLLFGLQASGYMTITWLFGLTIFLGVVAAFNQPARLALIPSLVPRQDLSSAVALNSVVFNLARFFGPATAGLLIATGGLDAAFAVNAVSFLAFLYALHLIKLNDEPTGMKLEQQSLLRDTAEGFRHVVEHPGLGPLLLLLIALSVCVRPVVELLPGLSDDLYNRGAIGLAALTSAIGIGAVVGGLWLGLRQSHHGLARITMAGVLGSAFMVAAMVATGIFWLALVCATAAGACMVVCGISSQTLIQLSVAPHMRGRVLSLYGLIVRGGPSLGALIMGTASDITGLRWPFLVGAALTVAAWWLVWQKRDSMTRHLEPEPLAAE